MKSAVASISLSAIFWMALCGVAYAEKISRFESDIQIAENGTLMITEVIDYDFEDAERHGIYRNIPDTYSGEASAWYKDRYIDFEVLLVTRNGVVESYQREPYNGLSLKIGNPDETITGVHRYRIMYEVVGAILAVDDAHELYWNATGNEWPLFMESVKVTVRTSPGMLQDASACYAGSVGTNQACTLVARSGEAVVFSQDFLGIGEGLTVAQLLQFKTPPPVLERYNSVFLYSVLFVVWSIALIVYAARWRFKYRTPRAIIAQYDPLPDFKPMFTGVLIDGTLDPCDITAGIVYLAQQGFISIRKTTEKVLLVFEVDDYEVILNRPVAEAEDSVTHRELLRLLFEDVSAVGSAVRISKLKRDETKMRQNYAALKSIKSAIKLDLRLRGYFEWYPKNYVAALGPTFFILLFILLEFSFSEAMLHFMLFIEAVIGSLLIMLSVVANRRTVAGYEALNYLKGFKDFLSVTDKDRFTFHNAPALSPEVFMDYLPYAIAFGVEKQWSEVFKDINIQNPTWYAGNEGVSAFNAATFVGHLNMFSSSFTGTSSSRSSSSSGSFGGGFSGGGFGGGGGGSW